MAYSHNLYICVLTCHESTLQRAKVIWSSSSRPLIMKVKSKRKSIFCTVNGFVIYVTWMVRLFHQNSYMWISTQFLGKAWIPYNLISNWHWFIHGWPIFSRLHSNAIKDLFPQLKQVQGVKLSYNTLQEHQKFRSYVGISVISDTGFIIEVYGISYFEVCSLHWWHWERNSWTKNCILVFSAEWRGHISIFQSTNRLER